MKILFDDQSNPKSIKCIQGCIGNFRKSYKVATRNVISNSQSGLNQKVFCKNVAILMPSFGMTRNGRFKGVKYNNNAVVDPKGIIAKCWSAIGNDTIQLRNFLNGQTVSKRARMLVEMPISAQHKTSSDLWSMFKKLLPLCNGETSLGVVGASKVLFAALPEVALPIDNEQWVKVFSTVDYGDIISLMIDEVIEWEKQTGSNLDSCDHQQNTSISVVYNVMAMKARP